jgi:hypothetical protein
MPCRKHRTEAPRPTVEWPGGGISPFKVSRRVRCLRDSVRYAGAADPPPRTPSLLREDSSGEIIERVANTCVRLRQERRVADRSAVGWGRIGRALSSWPPRASASRRITLAPLLADRALLGFSCAGRTGQNASYPLDHRSATRRNDRQSRSFSLRPELNVNFYRA